MGDRQVDTGWAGDRDNAPDDKLYPPGIVRLLISLSTSTININSNLFAFTAAVVRTRCTEA